MKSPPPLRMSRIARKFLYPNAVSTLADRSQAEPEQVHIVLLPGKETPDEDTLWIPVPDSPEGRRIMVAGPAADPAGAVVVPAGGIDLWIRSIDGQEIDVFESCRIIVY